MLAAEVFDLTTHGPAFTGLALVALAAVLALALLVAVDLPGGGSVPLGTAVLIALPVLTGPVPATSIDAIALLVVAGARAAGTTRIVVAPNAPDSGLPSLFALTAGAAATVAAAGAARRLVDPMPLTRAHVLEIVVFATAAAAIAVDVGDRALRPAAARPRLRSLLSVDLCLACAAALLVLLSSKGGPVAGLIALVPLGVLTASYAAHAYAVRTLDEAVDALSTLPEVSGSVAAGHGLRVEHYVLSLAARLDVPESAHHLLRDAARLHHLDDVVSPASPILARAGVTSEVTDLLDACRNPARRPADRLAALLRVACTFDAAVGDDPGAVIHGVAAVTATHGHGEEGRVAAALNTLAAEEPRLVADALAHAALGSHDHSPGDHEHEHDHHGHEHDEGDDCR